MTRQAWLDAHRPVLTPAERRHLATTVRKLAKQFGIKPPKLRFTATRGGHATMWQITMPRRQSWKGLGNIPTLLHEFAHSLRGQKEWYRPRASGKRREVHGTRFIHYLELTIKAYGWTLHQYPWHLEYRGIYNWAKREGLTRERHFQDPVREAAENFSPVATSKQVEGPDTMRTTS